MPALYQELPLPAQSAYAELFESTRARELQRSIQNLSGSFAKKHVKGRLYWYYQYRDVDSRVRQLYVGPDSDKLRQLTEQAQRTPRQELEPLAQSAIALGCVRVLPR